MQYHNRTHNLFPVKKKKKKLTTYPCNDIISDEFMDLSHNFHHLQLPSGQIVKKIMNFIMVLALF